MGVRWALAINANNELHPLTVNLALGMVLSNKTLQLQLVNADDEDRRLSATHILQATVCGNLNGRAWGQAYIWSRHTMASESDYRLLAISKFLQRLVPHSDNLMITDNTRGWYGLFDTLLMGSPAQSWYPMWTGGLLLSWGSIGNKLPVLFWSLNWFLKTGLHGPLDI